VFSGFLNRIHNDLIVAIGDAIRHNNIKKEISAASFVAVEVNEKKGETLTPSPATIKKG